MSGIRGNLISLGNVNIYRHIYFFQSTEETVTNSGLKDKGILYEEYDGKHFQSKKKKCKKKNKLFLRNASLTKVKGLIRITLGDEVGMLGWSHIVNDMYVLGEKLLNLF